jgi:hypothetical protein
MNLKTALFVVGGGLGAFALYRYLVKQFALAMNWDYKLKYLTFGEVQGNTINLEGVLDIINPSNFSLIVNSYSLDFYYKGEFLAHAESNTPIEVQPDATFPAPIRLSVAIPTLKGKALPFAQDVYNQRPIVFGIEGTANVNFGGITRNVELNIPDYEYSADIAEEYGQAQNLAETRNFLCQKLYICL